MKKLVNVILSIDSGKAYFPKHIPGRLCYSKPFPYSRMGEVYNMITEEGKSNKYYLSKINKEVLSQLPMGKFYTLTGELSNVFYYIREPETFNERIFATHKVDTGRVWTIDVNKDGIETIAYLKDSDNYEIIDEALNYAKRVD